MASKFIRRFVNQLAIASKFRFGAILSSKLDYNFIHSVAPLQNRAIVEKKNIFKKLKHGKVRIGGRDGTGRKSVGCRGGGHKRLYRLIDFVRAPLVESGPKTAPLPVDIVKSKVLAIEYDPNRSARIAQVADMKRKYILAPIGLEAGDIITASRGPPTSLADIQRGDAYPLQHLPIGTIVHNIELVPGKGGQLVRSAGTSAQIIRKEKGEVRRLNTHGTYVTRPGKVVVIRMPSGTDRPINANCMGTVGRLSNENHKHRILGKAGRMRWLGWRPRMKKKFVVKVR